MTFDQYQKETAQNALDARLNAKTDAERQAAIKAFSLALNTAQFWTEERIADYERFADAPNGTINARYKD